MSQQSLFGDEPATDASSVGGDGAEGAGTSPLLAGGGRGERHSPSAGGGVCPPARRPGLNHPLSLSSDEGSRPSEEVSPFEYWATPVEPGRTLVEASAGTGKTFAIAGLVLRLVLDGEWLGASPDLRRLLVVTFTKAATEELKTRIRAALRTALAVARGETEPDDLTRPLVPLLDQDGAESRLLAALDRVDEAGIFTIHSFCRRVLEQAAFESGTPFEMEFVEDSDSAALRARAAADAWAALTHDDPVLAALAVSEGATPDALAQHHVATADFPDVRILPETPTFAEARAALDDALRQLRKAWTPAAVEDALDGVEWNKNAPLGGDAGASLVARVAAFAQGDDPDALPVLRDVTPDAVYKAGQKRGKAKKEALEAAAQAAPFRAVEAAVEAADAVLRAFTREFVLEVGRRIEAIKERRGQLTFNDLITRLHDAILSGDAGAALAAGIRRQFSVALIDEFQDTDPRQYSIFRTAFEGCPLYFVGDPKQAIYAFRGADVHAYLRAQREATRRFTLGTNWRSTAGLVEAVNRVFERPERAFLFDGIPFRRVNSSPANREPRLVDGDAPPLVWWRMPVEGDRAPGKTAASEAIPPVVAAEICRLLAEARLRNDGKERPLLPRDVAVLVPSKYEIQAVHEALQAVGVPAVVSKALDVRESAEMADVELVLRAVLRPDDERALRAALATALWGWSATRIAALDDDPAGHAALAGRLRQWQAAWRRHGVLHVLTELGQQERVVERLLAFPDGERRVTNLRHAAELLHEIEAQGGRSPEDLAHWLRHRTEQALPSREMKELRLERDADAVTITTHHNAKGLEYEVVFLPYLWSLSQRDFQQQETVLARTDDGVVYDLGSDRADEVERLRQVDNLAEHVRKAYVALTRARERCYVVWGAVRSGSTRIDALCGLGYLLKGHEAERGESLADHIEAARALAAKGSVTEPVDALDPDGRVMRYLDPPTPAISQAEGEDETPAKVGEAATLDGAARQRARDAWRRASFSAWTRAAHVASDDDGLAASDEADDDTAPAEAVPTGIHAFAAGTGPGTCLHQILEAADWREGPEHAEAAAAHNRETAERLLTAHGLNKKDRRPHRGPIEPLSETLALLRRVAAAPLFGDGLRLADAEASFAEWSFAVPLGRVAPRDLAAVFREHGTGPFGADYADALAGLSRDAIDGLMVGEIDLVALAGDRWWVVDWKSNRLGDDASAYAPAALADVMRGHHYGLQLHLYTLGLHRFLRSRLGEAYDYDAHVGGATYAFLRGLEDEAVLAEDDRQRPARSGAGLFRHRPSAALIDVLDRLPCPDA